MKAQRGTDRGQPNAILTTLCPVMHLSSFQMGLSEHPRPPLGFDSCHLHSDSSHVNSEMPNGLYLSITIKERTWVLLASDS